MPVEAVLTCWGNSHPFLERKINLLEAVKIGRSVAQSRPANNNAIFDCKVLSRNHALLWHDGGKFFIQDSKSSNGTFVNNQRLSKSNEESAPRQLSTSDILQFGVDVVENARKVTHSCIMATIKLFDEEGNEIKNATLDSSSSTSNTFQSQEFYQLVHYLQEALHREQLLEEKLSTLQQLVLSTDQSAMQGWKNQINEDKLLARLDILENQLCVFNKLQPEESIKKEVLALQNDKIQYEIEAKSSLQQIIEEKLELSQKLAELETLHSSQQKEVERLEGVQTGLQGELEAVLEKHKVLHDDHGKLKEESETSQKHADEERSKLSNDNTHLNKQLQLVTDENNTLLNKIEILQADKDFSTEQLNNIKDKMKSMKTQDKGDLTIDYDDKGVQAEMINLFDIKSLMNMQKGEGGDDDDADDVDDVDKVKIKIVCNDKINSVADKDDNSDDEGDDDDCEEDDDDDEDDEDEDNIGFEFCEKSTASMHEGDTIKMKKKKSMQKSGNNVDELSQDEKASKINGGHQEGNEMRECVEERMTKLKVKPDTNRSQQERVDVNVKHTPLKNSFRSLQNNEAIVDDLKEDLMIGGDKGRGVGVERKREGVIGGKGEGGMRNEGVLGESKELVLQNDSNITDSQKELQEKDLEISSLEQICQESRGEVDVLHSQLDSALQDFSALSQHSQSMSIFSVLPFLALLVSLVMAFYPFFSSTTATSSVSL